MAWGYISKIADFLFAFFFSVYVGRSLGPRVYGQYSLFTNVVATILLFSALGFEGILNKYLPAFSIRADKRAFSLLTLQLCGARLVLLGIVGMLLGVNKNAASSFFGDAIFARFMSLLVFLLLLKGLQSFFISFLNAFLKIKEATLAGVSSQVLAIVLAVGLFSVFQPSLQNVLLATVFATLFSLILLLFFSRRMLAVSWKGLWDLRAIPWRFGLSVWQVNVLAFAVSAAFNIILMGRILKDSREIGYFSTALLFSYLPGNLISSWAGVILPSLSEAKAKYGLGGVAEAFVKFNKAILLLLIPSLGLLLIISKTLIVSFFGPDFLPAVKLLQVYIFCSLLVVPFSPHVGINACYVLDKEKAVLVIRFMAAVLNIALVWFLVPTLRAMGAMLASCLAIVVQTTAEFFVSQKYLKMPYPVSFLSKVIMATLLGVLCLAILPLQNLISVAAAAVLYSGILFFVFRVSRLLTSEDRVFLARVAPWAQRWIKYL
jgi:O-antigen/teichoic acid export membrane protein